MPLQLPARQQPEAKPMANILVCDDERSICELLDISLCRENHRVETVNSGEAAKRKIDGALYDVIVTDIKMPKIDGIEVLRYAHQISPDSAVILITAVDDYEAAVEAVKAGGAADYIRKSPGLVDEIKLAINRALEKVALSKQNFALRRDAATRNSLDNIIGVSPAMEKLKQTTRTVASTNSTILIYGESGTGKELVARAVHVCSPRDRREDIPLLVNHFLKKYAPAAGKSILRVHPQALDSLCGYEWPGNVRQLENTVERAVALEMTDELHVELPAERPKTKAAGANGGAAVPAAASASGAILPEGVDMEKYVAQIERSLLQAALNRSHGVQTRASELLG